MKQQFLKGIGGTIRLTTYDKNRNLIPTVATIIVYKNDGNSQLDAGSASIDGTTGEMTFTISPTVAANNDVNYKAVWSYTISGNVYIETQLFDIVKSILSIPINDDDLYNELPSLKKSNFQATGTATAGDASSLTDSKARKESDDNWKGGTLEILANTGAGQTRDITGSTQSTGVIAVSPDWGTTPDSTSTYRIVKSFTSTIQAAFEKIEQMLYNKGKRDALILESSQIRIPLIYLTIQMIAIDLREEKDDRWSLIADDYQKMYEQSFSSLALDYDEDESGGAQGNEVQQTVTSLRIQRS